MGVTIHYMGRMGDPERVDEMIQDLRELAERKGWRSWTVDELVAMEEIRDDGLRGITISVHPKCESVHLHVDEEGRFVHHGYRAMMNDPRILDAFERSLELTGAATGEPLCSS
jgi:hypothetical protein